ncbi:MAG: tripartite tricarboxylate transporter TctB family protein, partial [Devosia sp.]
IDRYGTGWLSRPLVVALFALAFVALARPVFAALRAPGGIGRMTRGLERPRLRPAMLFTAAVLLAVIVMMVEASRWTSLAATVPLTVGALALLFGGGSLIAQGMRSTRDGAESGGAMHMELVAETEHLSARTIAARAGTFMLWLVGILVGWATVGIFVTTAVFTVAYMRAEARERWVTVIGMAVGLTVFLYVVFERILHIPFPRTLLGELVPALRAFPGL